MFEELFTPNFLLYFSALAGAVGFILYKLSKNTTATNVPILAVNGRKLKAQQQPRDKEKEKLQKELAYMKETVRELKISQRLAPLDNKEEKECLKLESELKN